MERTRENNYGFDLEAIRGESGRIIAWRIMSEGEEVDRVGQSEILSHPNPNSFMLRWVKGVIDREVKL